MRLLMRWLLMSLLLSCCLLAEDFPFANIVFNCESGACEFRQDNSSEPLMLILSAIKDSIQIRFILREADTARFRSLQIGNPGFFYLANDTVPRLSHTDFNAEIKFNLSEKRPRILYALLSDTTGAQHSYPIPIAPYLPISSLTPMVRSLNLSQSSPDTTVEVIAQNLKYLDLRKENESLFLRGVNFKYCWNSDSSKLLLKLSTDSVLTQRELTFFVLLRNKIDIDDKKTDTLWLSDDIRITSLPASSPPAIFSGSVYYTNCSSPQNFRLSAQIPLTLEMGGATKYEAIDGKNERIAEVQFQRDSANCYDGTLIPMSICTDFIRLQKEGENSPICMFRINIKEYPRIDSIVAVTRDGYSKGLNFHRNSDNEFLKLYGRGLNNITLKSQDIDDPKPDPRSDDQNALWSVRVNCRYEMNSAKILTVYPDSCGNKVVRPWTINILKQGSVDLEHLITLHAGNDSLDFRIPNRLAHHGSMDEIWLSIDTAQLNRCDRALRRQRIHFHLTYITNDTTTEESSATFCAAEEGESGCNQPDYHFPNEKLENLNKPWSRLIIKADLDTNSVTREVYHAVTASVLVQFKVINLLAWTIKNQDWVNATAAELYAGPTFYKSSQYNKKYWIESIGFSLLGGVQASKDTTVKTLGYGVLLSCTINPLNCDYVEVSGLSDLEFKVGAGFLWPGGRGFVGLSLGVGLQSVSTKFGF